MKLNRILAVALLLVAALSLAGCGGGKVTASEALAKAVAIEESAGDLTDDAVIHYGQALTLAREILAARADDEQGLYIAAVAASKLAAVDGAYIDEAFEYFRALADEYPQNTAAMLAYSHFLEDAGEPYAALVLMSALLADQAPDNPALLARRADLLMKIQAPEVRGQALAYAEADLLRIVALTSVPDGDAAMRGQAESVLGLLYYEVGNYEEAISRLQSATQLLPGNPTPLFYQGLSLKADGREAEGQALIESALQMLAERDPAEAARLRQLID